MKKLNEGMATSVGESARKFRIWLKTPNPAAILKSLDKDDAETKGEEMIIQAIQYLLGRFPTTDLNAKKLRLAVRKLRRSYPRWVLIDAERILDDVYPSAATTPTPKGLPDKEEVDLEQDVEMDEQEVPVQGGSPEQNLRQELRNRGINKPPNMNDADWNNAVRDAASKIGKIDDEPEYRNPILDNGIDDEDGDENVELDEEDDDFDLSADSDVTPLDEDDDIPESVPMRRPAKKRSRGIPGIPGTSGDPKKDVGRFI